MHFVQGTPTEGVAYPCVVTVIVEHKPEYWACQVEIIGHHLGGYKHKLPKEVLHAVEALAIGIPLVLIKKHGRVRVYKAPAGSDTILLPGAVHLKQADTYPRTILAQFPKLRF